MTYTEPIEALSESTKRFLHPKVTAARTVVHFPQDNSLHLRHNSQPERRDTISHLPPLLQVVFLQTQNVVLDDRTGRPQLFPGRLAELTL